MNRMGLVADALSKRAITRIRGFVECAAFRQDLQFAAFNLQDSLSLGDITHDGAGMNMPSRLLTGFEGNLTNINGRYRSAPDLRLKQRLA